jgi:hypothetical protein
LVGGQSSHESLGVWKVRCLPMYIR